MSDERPAVAPNLSDMFPLGSFNSKNTIGAELTARGVPWSVDDPWIQKETNIGLTFKQKLKVRSPPTANVVVEPDSPEARGLLERPRQRRGEPGTSSW